MLGYGDEGYYIRPGRMLANTLLSGHQYRCRFRLASQPAPELGQRKMSRISSDSLEEEWPNG